jgi:uncharacterized protein YkwD
MPPAATRRIRLVATGSLGPREFSAASRKISIGSAAGNDLVIDETTVSRHHAKIQYRGGICSVIDLESTNGTFVNGERVRGSLTFKAGDELSFGSARYRYNPLNLAAAKKLAVPVAKSRSFLLKPGITVRKVVILAVLFASAFAATEFQIIWSKIDQLATGRTRSPSAASAINVAELATPAAPLFSPVAPATSSPAAPMLSPLAPSASEMPGVAAPANSNGTSSLPPQPVAVPVSGTGAPAAISSAVTAVESANPSALAATGASPALLDGAGPDTSWLDALNHYRWMAGLAPVTIDPALTQAVEAHAHYVVANYSGAIESSSLGSEAHTEDPVKPYYSAAGLAAASASAVDTRFQRSGTPPALTEAIDGWISVPFHRLPLLNPGLRRVAFGRYCEGGVCASVLNVWSGADRSSWVPTPLPRPVMFPPDESMISNGTADSSEWPNPLTSCAGYSVPFGLAISVQLGAHIEVRMTNYSITRADGFAAPVQACGFDADSYVNPDPAQQKNVHLELINFGAVIVVPREPLAPGKYNVSITANGQPYSWSFSIDPGAH